MSVQMHADDEPARPLSAFETVVLGVEPPDRRRPNVSGDLSTVFQAAPMFRRAVAGYDRFQVDTYVQWAEDELATADREREHLVARHLRTREELEEARQLLSHSSDGGEMLRLSRRVGSMLAAAADEAESMRTEADALRSAASAEAEQTVARAERVLVDAEAEAERMVTVAATEVEAMTAAAGRIVDEAEQTGRNARAEAEARLEGVRLLELRAAEHGGRLRQVALAEASAARLQARDEIVRMLNTARDERRRADAEAAATRERLVRDAATRAAALLAEVEAYSTSETPSGRSWSCSRNRSAVRPATGWTFTSASSSRDSGGGPGPCGRPDGPPVEPGRREAAWTESRCSGPGRAFGVLTD
jgi:cell division septum initiation protein DivIVA